VDPGHADEINLRARSFVRIIGSMTLRPPSADYQLPRLARKSRQALEQEGRALSTARQEFAQTAPADGCPWEVDVATASRADDDVRAAQQWLLEWCQHQARLIYVNGHDHLTSMARLLGSDGAMSLYAHVTPVAQRVRGCCPARVAAGRLDQLRGTHCA
jgi:hypothetical protein